MWAAARVQRPKFLWTATTTRPDRASRIQKARPLRRWWLSTGDREFTSVTFLIDREGVIRAVHPGGEFHAGGGSEHATCAQDYAALQRAIERLLE